MPPDLVGQGLAWPLIDRPMSDVVCRRAGRAITVGQLLAEAATLAARLPAAAEAHAINLCADRYRMLVGFVAALLRGHVTLLNADASPARLGLLAATHAGCYVLADGTAPNGLPMVAIQLDPEPPVPGPLPPVPAIPLDRIVAVGFTSGSTAEPTAHPKPWGALVAAASAAAERFALRAADGPRATILATVPPQHMYGFETTIMLPLQAAVTIYAGASFFPSDVLDSLAALPPRRLLVTTPLHLRALLAEGRRPAPLAAVISATAPLAAGIAAAVERDWHAPMLEIYGATEAGSMASRRTIQEADWLPYRGVECRAEGVYVPGLGEVRLGDLLKAGPGGRFRLLGRRSDMVKLAGRRASLADLNRRLLEVEGVRDGVFVAPDDIERNPAARLAAYVVAPGRSVQEILAGLRAKLEPLFLPRPVWLVPSLPRDRLGKLSQRALSDLRLTTARNG
ncbi:AMP-binding protein [Dankookia rubra]|nr:AMP-binding protein [Dankookia rubra]